MASCGARDGGNGPYADGVYSGFAVKIPTSSIPACAHRSTRSSKREETMLLFGRSRSRRGLASALIGEIAAIIDDMEGFEEVRKLEEMEIGADEHLDELGAFTLPKFLVYESNADRLDLFEAAIQRQITYFFTRAGSLAGHLHALASTKNESKELCKQHAIDAQQEINSLSELGDDLLRDLRKLVSKKQPSTISRA
jgi:hypothetical protein